MSSASPFTFNYFTLLALASYKPRSNASYSAVLLVLWKSNLKEKEKMSLEGEMRTTPVPEPEFEQLPLNSRVHKASSELTISSSHGFSGRII
jgi:hypothetical protein